MKLTTRQLTLCAVLTAMALALSYLENFFPLSLAIPIPGIKLGLANIVTLFALYALGPGQALLILLARRYKRARKPGVRLRRERRQTALVDAARTYFAKNLERELRVDEVCEAIGCTRPQLQAAFRTRLRHTAMEEFSAMRLDYAAQLLARGALPGEVAAEMGYCSGAHFSKKFREATGNTPAEYRRQQMYLTSRRQNRQQKDMDPL